MLHEQYANKITVDSGFPAVNTVTDRWNRVLQSRSNGVHGFAEVQANDCWLIVRIRETINAVNVDSYHVIGPGSSIIERVSPVYTIEVKAEPLASGASFSDIAGFMDGAVPDPFVVARWSRERMSEAESFSTGAIGLLGASIPAGGGSYTILRPVKTLRTLIFSCSTEVKLSIYREPFDVTAFGGYRIVEEQVLPAKTSATLFCGGFTSVMVTNLSVPSVAYYRADWRKGVA